MANIILPIFGERRREEVRATDGTGEDTGACTVGVALVQIRGHKHQLSRTITTEIPGSKGGVDVTWVCVT